ncbi:MAG: uracil-DNA glycosylase [Sulfurimonadaceae bacterium]|jgi:DNA polymerase|nr:uracil-DNA glycosylase [Sulfurimonadaceae bacterium]
MKSVQNLLLLQNLYRIKALGFEYIDSFTVNTTTDASYEKPFDLEQLMHNISTCHLCDLNKSRKQSMGGFGNPQAQLMFIDFSVSSAEDSSNSYFCGRSGDTLQKMIENVLELRLEDIYFTHAIKCKPLSGNIPSSSEWDSCQHYLFSQIDFVKPKIIVTLGEEAYRYLTGEEDNFSSVRGHVINFKNHKLIPMMHPQYLLRNPQSKKIAMNDLLTIKGFL